MMTIIFGPATNWDTPDMQQLNIMIIIDNTMDYWSQINPGKMPLPSDTSIGLAQYNFFGRTMKTLNK